MKTVPYGNTDRAQQTQIQIRKDEIKGTALDILHKRTYSKANTDNLREKNLDGLDNEAKRQKRED